MPKTYRRMADVRHQGVLQQSTAKSAQEAPMRNQGMWCVCLQMAFSASRGDGAGPLPLLSRMRLADRSFQMNAGPTELETEVHRLK